jgi:predicted amidohydrolase
VVHRRSFLGGGVALLGWTGASLADQDAPEAPPPRTASSVRVGMAQMLVKTGAIDDNVARARTFIERGHAEKCDVVVLPECLDFGWTLPDVARRAFPIPGPVSDTLTEEARAREMWVVAGLTERLGERIYNTSILIDDRGRIRLKHHKINELEIARDLYARGTELAVADTPFGRVGITICADNSPASIELGLALGRMGAGLILSPCAWAVEPDYDNEKEPYGRDVWDAAYRTLGEKGHVAVVGVSNVGRLEAGPWAGRLCIGSSLATGRDGSVLARAPYGADAETLQVVEIPLAG